MDEQHHIHTPGIGNLLIFLGQTASYFLNDTTLANPQLINSGAPFTLYLSVTDNTGNSAIDSVYLDFYNYDVILGYAQHDIMQGDSIFLSGWEDQVADRLHHTLLFGDQTSGLKDSDQSVFLGKTKLLCGLLYKSD